VVVRPTFIFTFLPGVEVGVVILLEVCKRVLSKLRKINENLARAAAGYLLA
jgi:hypothetical protein